MVALANLDVIYVIACHLAGSHAFGTLAALHIANRNVAETVLPVLYETVLLDDQEGLLCHEREERGFSGGFRYTRFLFCTELMSKMLTALDKFLPNLVAIFSISHQSPMDIAEKLRIVLLKLVTTATLFGTIAFTPPRRSPSGSESLAFPPGALHEATSLASDLPQTRVADFDLPRELEAFDMDEGVSLLPEPTVASSWTTSVRLVYTTLDCAFGPDPDQRALDTTFELLKLAGRQYDCEGFRDASSSIVSSETFTYPTYHICLNASKRGYDEFAEQFAREAALHPEILLNRIKIVVHAEISYDDFQQLVDDMLPIYFQHFPSIDGFPSGIRPPQNLLTLLLDDLPPEEERFRHDWQEPPLDMSVQLVGAGAGMRFVNSEEALMEACSLAWTTCCRWRKPSDSVIASQG